MPSTRDIRRRIKSVKNTAQITRAMQLVAASKMKKAQDQALAGRAYAGMLNKILNDIQEDTEDSKNPLLEVREGTKEALLVITTDKGLCGPLNTNLLKQVLPACQEDTQIVTVGSKGRRSLAKLGKNMLADFEIKDPVPFAEAKVIAGFLRDQFLEGKVDKVRIAFTNFINTIKQEPILIDLLPICHTGVTEGEAIGEVPAGGYLFEPNVEQIFDHVLPLYLNYQVYQMLLEARASEHSARMVAMKSATDNAKELISDLTLQYNKVRQAAITNELLEITTAMKALE
ncbi:MAG: ATP synthase F1 subunit gamma [Verrucomicrobiota bacterium]